MSGEDKFLRALIVMLVLIVGLSLYAIYSPHPAVDILPSIIGLVTIIILYRAVQTQRHQNRFNERKHKQDLKSQRGQIDELRKQHLLNEQRQVRERLQRFAELVPHGLDEARRHSILRLAFKQICAVAEVDPQMGLDYVRTFWVSVHAKNNSSSLQKIAVSTLETVIATHHKGLLNMKLDRVTNEESDSGEKWSTLAEEIIRAIEI